MARNRVQLKPSFTLISPSRDASYRELGLSLRWLIAKRGKDSVETHSASWAVLSLMV